MAMPDSEPSEPPEPMTVRLADALETEASRRRARSSTRRARLCRTGSDDAVKRDGILGHASRGDGHAQQSGGQDQWRGAERCPQA